MKRTSAILLLSFLILASVFCARSGAQEGGTTPNLGLQYPSRNQGLDETVTNDINIINNQFAPNFQVITSSTWTSPCVIPSVPTGDQAWTTPAFCGDLVVLGNNVTFYFPPSPLNGEVYSLSIGQPNTGGPYSVSWGSPISWVNDGTGTISMTPGVFSNFTCVYGSSSSAWSCQRHYNYNPS